MALDPLTAALEAGKTILDKIWPDAGEAEKARVTTILTVFAAQADIVKAEAQSTNWLTASWRPITMLTFTTLIVARWFGMSAPDLSPEEYLKLWDIVQLGLGGYVVGRSVEKVAGTVAGILKK
jgi:hypothetical protein